MFLVTGDQTPLSLTVSGKARRNTQRCSWPTGPKLSLQTPAGWGHKLQESTRLLVPCLPRVGSSVCWLSLYLSPLELALLPGLWLHRLACEATHATYRPSLEDLRASVSAPPPAPGTAAGLLLVLPAVSPQQGPPLFHLGPWALVSCPHYSPHPGLTLWGPL